MKMTCRRWKAAALLLSLILALSVWGAMPAGAAEPDAEFRVSSAWISRLTQGEDYDGIDHGVSADLPAEQYYFVKYRVSGYLFIGNFSMNGIQAVTYDVTNSPGSEYPAEGRLLLCADKEGTRIIASSELISDCGWNTPKTGSFEVLDSAYSGPLYMVMSNGSGHEYQVANLKFYSTDPSVTEESTEVPTEVPTEAPTEEPTEAPTEAPTEVPTDTEVKEYTVTFVVVSGDLAVPAAQTVKEGDCAVSPKLALRDDGSHFSGWYTSEDLSAATKFDFSTPITADLTLYASLTPPTWGTEKAPLTSDDGGCGAVMAMGAVLASLLAAAFLLKKRQ